MSKAKLVIDEQSEAGTTMACSNATKSLVLSMKKIGESYDETISRVFNEYRSSVSMFPNKGVIER